MSSDAEVASDLATRAGELLLQLRARMGFGDPDGLRDAGDQHSHEFLVAELEREGRITAAEARVHPQRNIVTRVLGNEPDVEVDALQSRCRLMPTPERLADALHVQHRPLVRGSRLSLIPRGKMAWDAFTLKTFRRTDPRKVK